MKMLSEKQALLKLRKLKGDFQNFIRKNYERRAKDCLTCPTQGACCVDAHFVNVHITPLEAVAIRRVLLEKLSAEKLQQVNQRIARTIEKYNLKIGGETFEQTYACPLFESKVGCVVHAEAKPAACIQHACYKEEKDLPPQCLQDNAERRIEKLNRELYGDDWRWLPLPIQLSEL